MKKYSKKFPKFTRDQLIFIVEVMITSAIGAVDASRPDVSDMPQNIFNAMIQGILEKIGFDLSILYAQITGDGIGCCDVREMTRIDDIIEYFADHPKKKINTKQMATKFVDELFEKYLLGSWVNYDVAKMDLKLGRVF
jgi:hypothetical protein